MEAYMGYVMFTAGSFAPDGWSLCQGQLLGVSQNTALYTLLGSVYGGDGQSNFALPNLGGRTPIGTGQAPGVGHNYQAGEIGGTEQTTILNAQMPMHVHALTTQPGLTVVTDNTVDNTYPQATDGARLGSILDTSGGSAAPAVYVPAGSGGTTVNLAGGSAGTTAIAGSSQPMSVMQPYLAMNAVICIQGLYPPRP